jgi:hypothetical protein
MSSIWLARRYEKHVDQCMFEFAVEPIGIDQMTTANEEEHMMSDLRFQGWFSESNLYVSVQILNLIRA